MHGQKYTIVSDYITLQNDFPSYANELIYDKNIKNKL